MCKSLMCASLMCKSLMRFGRKGCAAMLQAIGEAR